MMIDKNKAEQTLLWNYLGELTEAKNQLENQIKKVKDKVLRMSPFLYDKHLSEIGVSEFERKQIIKKRFGVDLYD